MYNRNINRLTAVIQSPIAPRSTNVLWDDLVSNTLKVYRKGIWTVIGGAGGGGEGSSLYWGYDETQGVIFPLEQRSVQINGDLTVNGDITARKLSVAELEIDGEPFASYWELDSNTNTLSTTYQVLIKNSLVVEQDTSSGGDGQDTPSAGLDEEQLQDYLDLHKYVTEDDIAGLIPDVDLSDYYTKAESDARYLALSGGTITAPNKEEPLTLDSAMAQVRLLIQQTGSSKSTLGWHSSFGTWMYDHTTGCSLGIRDTNGTPFYYDTAFREIIHSGNVGSYNAGGFNVVDIRGVNPTPYNSGIEHAVTAWFNKGADTPNKSSYYGGISVKGWTNDYRVWQLASSSTSYLDSDKDLWFRTGVNDTWQPWRRIVSEDDDGYIYGLGGMIDIQYTDEINRYGGNLHLQHRGGVGTTGSGTGGTTTGHILMCAYGGNVLIGTATDSGYKLDVNGEIKATKPIFGYMYGTNTNAAAFMYDKPGLHYTGIGSNGTNDTIRFSACNADGTWVDGYAQNWKFYGDVKADKYRLNENDNSFIGTQVGYLSLNSMGNEICIGASGYNDIHINYRPSADGTAPKTYYWRAGSATSWADFYMGNTYIQGNLVVSGDVASA